MSSPAAYSPHVIYVRQLFRRALRTAQDWSTTREGFRQTCIDIRYQFEANRNVHNPKQLSAVLAAAEKDLKDMAHPEPYRYPTSPFGSKYERNVPVPKEIAENGFGDYVDPATKYGRFERNFINV
ncbi:hypothetical protein GGF32_006262 [Allomyces javanicus]|nr:hypothetical protein GGF32_006262 [Allomyces javanicus]